MKLIIISVAAAGLAAHLVFSGLATIRASHQCDNSAADWTTFANPQGMRDPAKEIFYATEFAKLSMACPDGNLLIDIANVPTTVQQLAMRPDIVQVALQKIEGAKNR